MPATAKQTRHPDFHVRNQGSVWSFMPLTPKATKACQDGTINIEDWQWSGPVFAVDHRMAADLVVSLRASGFTCGGYAISEE